MLGTPEIIIIVLVVVLLFGSTQLPKLARSLGQAQKEFKTGLQNGGADDEEPTADNSKKKAEDGKAN